MGNYYWTYSTLHSASALDPIIKGILIQLRKFNILILYTTPSNYLPFYENGLVALPRKNSKKIALILHY